jgi:chorismate mutase / prephenate dehydrogenase
MPLMNQELEAVRRRIRELDGELVERAAERVRLARRVGEIKGAEGRPVIDYAQERRVLEAAGAAAAERGLAPRVAEDLVARLIEAAVTVQEEDRLRHADTGEGRSAVVVGGAGRMGRWFVGFLENQGWRALARDPAAPREEDEAAARALADADLVVCSTPPRETARLYAEWRAAPPRGLLVDLASIKSPLVEPIGALRAAGARVASIHPMFGPDTPLLRDREVVLCDTGDADAMAAVEALFRPTTARLVRLPLADHDRVMAEVLSLAHATVLAFTFALPGEPPVVHSNTYRALARLAENATSQNPDVYFQIQALNPHALEAIERLLAGVTHVRDVVARHRRDDFAELLAAGARRLAPRRRPPDPGID